MPILNKTKNTAAIYNRGREVVKVYDHGKLAWQKSIPDYLCFTALEAGTFTLTIPAVLSTNANSRLSYIEWSKDGRSWNRTENKNSTEITIPVDVVTGDKVYWRGSGTSMTSASVALTSDCRFTSTARFNASGHLLSLLKLEDYDATTGWSSATFANLFYQATTLIDASGIILPALAAGNAYTFYGTFYGCTNLVAAPDFNTTYTGNYMCFQMYRDCTSLVAMPKLPSTLSTSIFSGMFRGCSSLSTAQPLNYTILAENCFANMFYGCSSLSHVKCLATDISATGCLTNWLYNVSSTGTFIQAEGVEWPRGASGIPTGWVDVEKRTMPQGYKQVLYVDNEHNSVQGAAYMSIGYPVNMKYDTIEIAFQQDTISNGMVLQSAANVAGKAWFYNYYNSSQHPFSIYVTNESGTQRGGVVYRPLDTEPHVVNFAADGTYGVVTHNGEVVISKYQVGDLPETCASNTLLFGSTTYRGKIFYFKNWDKDKNVLADYVPSVRESDGKVGFYDFASNSYKTHTQAGDWTAGEEI